MFFCEKGVFLWGQRYKNYTFLQHTPLKFNVKKKKLSILNTTPTKNKPRGHKKAHS